MQSRSVVGFRARVASAAAALLTSATLAAAQAPALKIVVIEGEDAVNVIQQKSAVAPLVEVRDRNDQPVAGAVVTFTITGSRAASFAGGRSTLTLTTNAAGRATASGLEAVGRGAFQVQVQATFQGQAAAATIAQSNVLTAAEVSGATSSAGGSAGTAAGAGSGAGGGLSGTTIGIIGAGAAAGAIGIVKATGHDNGAPTVTGVTASPTTALQSSTAVSFSSQATDPDGKPLTFAWDFGDGGSGAGASPTHVFTSAGTFQVRVTATDDRNATATGQTTVTVKSVSGRWSCFTCAAGANSFYTLTQTGTAITGTFLHLSGAVLPVTGTVQTGSPQVTFGYPAIPIAAGGTGLSLSFSGTTSSDLNTLTGSVDQGGQVTAAASVRQ